MIDLYGVLQEQETINGELGLGVDYYKGETGAQGIPGKDGSDQVYVGADEPTDERVKLWIDTDATPSSKAVSWDEIENKPEIPAPYTLPTASTSTLGGVKVDGNTITIADGVISAKGGSGGSEPNAYIKDASVSGNTLTLTKKDDTEVVFTPSGGSGGGSYTLPVADNDKLGGIKLGNTNQLTIQDNLGNYGASLHAGIEDVDVPIIPYAGNINPGVVRVIDSGSGLKYSNGTVSMSPASTTTYGTVAYDGKTIQAKLNQSNQPTLYAATATTSSLGVVKPDGTTTTVDSQGNLKANIDNDTIIVKDGSICVDKSQLSASNGLPAGGDYSQILIKNDTPDFDATWVNMSDALVYAGINVGTWRYTQDQYNSDLYNAKELVVCITNLNGNKQMGYFNFGDSGNLGGSYQNNNFYFEYDSSSPYIYYDGSCLSVSNYSDIIFIAYRT